MLLYLTYKLRIHINWMLGHINKKKLQALLQHECVGGTVAEPYRRLLSVHVTGGAGASKIGGVGLYEKAD